MGPFMAKEDEEYHKNIIEEINYQCIKLNVKKMLLKVTHLQCTIILYNITFYFIILLYIIL